MIRAFSLSVMIFLVFGCSSEYDKTIKVAYTIKEKDQNPNPVIDGEVEPTIPNQSENDKTILGIDSNKNGIRDDVDIWINRIALDSNERMAMRQYARAQQKRLVVCSQKNKSEISNVETNAGIAYSCLGAISDYQRGKKYKADHQIWMVTMNTSDRKECPKFFNQFTYSFGGSGAMSGHPHENCSFKIENVEEVIKKYRKFEGYLE